MEHTYTPEQIKEAFEKTVNIACVYLQQCQDAANKVAQQIKETKEEEISKELKIAHSMVYERMASLLDIVHKSFPVAFGLFPKNHENLNNVYSMHKRFENAKLLKPCDCDYCKENPVKIENSQVALEEQKQEKESDASQGPLQ